VGTGLIGKWQRRTDTAFARCSSSGYARAVDRDVAWVKGDLGTDYGYSVIYQVFPGIVTYDRYIEDARELARDAIVCHLRGLLKDGEAIP
jgi:predicted RNase H-like HicB family nuclease